MSVESATTELVRLPGLDVAVNTERPEAKPGHWIERGPLKRLMVFSGRSHPELAQPSPSSSASSSERWS